MDDKVCALQIYFGYRHDFALNIWTLLDTPEGLDATMTTRFYSRIRVAQLLLPLLNTAKSPQVMSVLAGGLEGRVKVEDLSLNEPRNYSVANASIHSATMGTLVLERFAAANPRVSFVHEFPGVVATPLFGRAAGGIKGAAIRYLIAPLLFLFARSPAEAGQRSLFAATSGRYSVGDGIVPLVLAGGVSGPAPQKAARSNAGKGIFLVNAKGGITDNERVLGPLRKKGVDKMVWDHTEGVFNSLR